MKKEYILVIDSGVGGLSVLKELCKILPAKYLYFADNKHCPYGSHSKSEITKFLTEIIDFYRKKYTIKLVVLACNTATTASIDKLRNRYQDICFVGTEPAIKLAKTMRFRHILSLTTPTTAKQRKYKLLKNSLNVSIKTVSLPHFASNIEHFLCCGTLSDELRTKSDIFFIKKLSKNHDCIVLGCTHYALIKHSIQKYIDIPVIDGNIHIARQALKCAQLLGINQANKATVKFVLSSQFSGSKQIYKKILGQILAK